MRRKDFIIGFLGLFVFSVFGYFFFGTIMFSITIPIWLVYYIGWGRHHD